jgi:soluble lytic murein transglycosylase-like protein
MFKNMYVDDSADYAQAILGGTRYLRSLANLFNGDLVLTLVAYRASVATAKTVKARGRMDPEVLRFIKTVLAKNPAQTEHP